VGDYTTNLPNPPKKSKRRVEVEYMDGVTKQYVKVFVADGHLLGAHDGVTWTFIPLVNIRAYKYVE
jgi:hypothetical protein